MGRRGRSWYRWAQDAGLEVVGVVDINRTILDESCDELKIPNSMRFENIAEAAKGTEAYVATVCAANPDHASCLTQCLDAGVHVIIEKPMVETLDDAKMILSKAKEKGLKVAVAQNYRYSPELRTIREAIQRGDIGKIASVSVTFHRWRPTQGLYLPLLMNQSIHHFDGIRWILDADPEWCFAKSFNPDWNDCDGPTVVEAVYGLNNGALATYSGSYVTQGRNTSYSGSWRIEGSTGQLTFAGSDKDNPVVLSRRDPEEQKELPLLTSELAGPAQVCREFLLSLEKGAVPPTDATDNIKSLAMCWAADVSSKENRVVRFEEFA
jgi:predicted dehydrogenase